MMNTGIGSWTDAQRKLLFSLMGKVDFTKEDMEASLRFPMSELSVSEASTLIDCFKNNGDLTDAVMKVREKHGVAKGPLDQVPEKPANSPAKAQVEPPASKEPSGLNIPKSIEEARKNKAEKIANAPAKAQPEPPITGIQSFGVIQIGDMTISEQDIDQLSKIPRMLNRIYQNVMQEGTDYGVIPGAGDKPTLLKPGAEMLRMAFNLRYKTEIDTVVEDWDKGMFYYRIKTHFFNSKDQYIGTGIGSANSEESRYSNRWVFESDIPEGIDKASLKSQERTSKKGSKYKVYLIEADIHEKATLVNTLQKMAKKRSFVDGILSITGASRIFTQDVEDMAGDRA